MSSYHGKALDILRVLPRVQHHSLKPNPGAVKKVIIV